MQWLGTAAYKPREFLGLAGDRQGTIDKKWTGPEDSVI